VGAVFCIPGRLRIEKILGVVSEGRIRSDPEKGGAPEEVGRARNWTISAVKLDASSSETGLRTAQNWTVFERNWIAVSSECLATYCF
jgi:hypothetical protein